jgi:hypothetical protein
MPSRVPVRNTSFGELLWVSTVISTEVLALKMPCASTFHTSRRLWLAPVCIAVAGIPTVRSTWSISFSSSVSKPAQLRPHWRLKLPLQTGQRELFANLARASGSNLIVETTARSTRREVRSSIFAKLPRACAYRVLGFHL